MKPSNELFHLVKSLTKSEKRFFKLSSSIQAGEKNYFKLFDYIDSQSAYDEQKLKDHFKKERFIKHLPSEKNHLYKLVLKSLRQFYGEQSASNILKQEIKNIEILYNKALHKESIKFLKRAKKLAVEHEEFYFSIELISWEKVLTEESYESGDFDVDLNNIIKEESEIIDKLRNLAEYHILYSKINALFRSDAFTKNEEERRMVNEIENHHLIKGKNTALSKRAASICYYIQGLCAATNRNFELSYKKFNRVRTILDANPKIKVDLGQRYVLTLFHLMQSYINGNDFTMAQEMIDQIKGLKGKKGFNSLHLTIRINNILLTDQMNLYNFQGYFDKSLAVFENQYLENEELIERSSKEQKIKFYFSAAYTLFATADYKGALQFLNLILNDNEQQLRQDIYSFARILNLLLHFELANYDYLEYSSNSAMRHLNKTKRDHQIEKVFIKQIKKIAKTVTEIETIPIYKNTLSQIELLLENENENVILDYINIVAWLKSKINNQSFSEVVQQEFKT
ncbi:hypothetical protein [Brumimicrobium oceani]|uniref:Uncharacterized protein n=1 Tax=Brumimicrobium oceani TaxID=2100725 RepID=A0A2U2XE66_9FLAO|nr:hypothetical protein [Brumimicrobium oceani]PWH86084.1 hypothetical protein DIT68_05880 [Brumimicrobium oceani]